MKAVSHSIPLGITIMLDVKAPVCLKDNFINSWSLIHSVNIAPLFLHFLPAAENGSCSRLGSDWNQESLNY